MTNPFAEALKTLIPSTSSHLTFEEQCGYYGALRSGVPNGAVAAAADIATVTASYLARAGELSGGQIRYRKVADEYSRLGHEAFVHRYVTARIRDRCLAEIENLNHGIKPERQVRHAKRTANGLVGVHLLKPRNPWQAETARVEVTETPEGYRSILLALGETTFKREHGERLGPFPTSRQAFLAARTKYTPTEDEMSA